MVFPAFDPARPIAIIGCGVMGAKVAWACARAGIPTRAFDTSAAQLDKSLALIRSWSEGEERAVLERCLTATATLEEALAGAQLAFENVPEDLDLKLRLHADVGRRLEGGAYMGSNTSSLLCSPLAEASGRPARFFNMNFTDPRAQGLVEIMGGPETAPEAIAFARAWAGAIGMVPILTRRENMGYSFNRLWRAIKKEVLHQVDRGYGDPEDIDRAWMLTFGTPYGPFGLMDQVGLRTVLKIEEQYFAASGDESDRPPAMLVAMVERGELGFVSGKGFYDYPDPAYERPGWLKGGS
ncbi:MAG: 3-hydroxyacyl-CoA dehydrogenase family protein [Alphaproteobacteria bacterium]|nr:3-hydroxyacyl-CoA dehydrogenase family protein [Alphaproteobacteria bacterium]